MSEQTGVDRPHGSPPRRSPAARRIVFGAVLAAIAAATAWMLLIDRDEEPPGRAAVGGTAGMEGMDMPSDGTVRLTADQIRQFGITFGAVEMRTLEAAVRTVGIVSFDETRIAHVAPKFGGFVDRLHVDYTGQAVQRGQALLDVYSPELVAAQQDLLVAGDLEQTMDRSAVPGVPAGSSNLLAAARRRLALWDISDAQIEGILRAGAVQRTLTLHAPSSGVVVEKHVVRGQAFQAGQTLYTIASLAEVWIEAELRESDAGGVREGAGATIELAGMPGRLFKGRIEYVYPTLAQASRTLKARIAVANADGRLKPGMYATVRITTPADVALTAPSSAIISTGERTLAFVDMGGGELMPTEIETGRTRSGYVEILSGLYPGQRVVTSAQFLLDSESNLGDVMRAMMGQMGASDMNDMPGMDMGGANAKGADMKGMPMTPMPPRDRR